MREQERRRYRREMERRMRARQSMRTNETQTGGLLTFRLYVTAVLVGGCFLISLFDTPTAQTVCARLKESIAAQISPEQLGEWQERAAAFLRENQISLPALPERAPAAEEQRIYLPDTEESP